MVFDQLLLDRHCPPALGLGLPRLAHLQPPEAELRAADRQAVRSRVNGIFVRHLCRIAITLRHLASASDGFPVADSRDARGVMSQRQIFRNEVTAGLWSARSLLDRQPAELGFHLDSLPFNCSELPRPA